MVDLIRKDATSTVGGELTTTTQTIVGAKTFTSPITGFATANAYNNLIINGNMDFWQRGTTGFSIGLGYNQYTADRWCFGKDTTPSTITVARSTDVPTFAQSGFQSTYSILATNNATGNTPGAADSLFINNRIEGNDYQQIHGKSVRIQFWVKSSVTGTYSFLIINKVTAGNSRNYATTYTINAVNTWEKKTIDVVMDTISPTGVWNLDNTVGAVLHWSLAAGASVQTSVLNTWQTSTGQVSATTSQTNWAGTNSATFQLAQVSLVPGSFPTTASLNFVRAGRTIQGELAACQRYFEKSYDVGTVPGTAVGNGQHITFSYAASGTATYGARFLTPKRATPTTITLYNSSTGGSGTWRDSQNGVDRTVSFDSAGETGFRILISSVAAIANNQGHFIADAEL
jgi:hypothetical protein